MPRHRNIQYLWDFTIPIKQQRQKRGCNCLRLCLSGGMALSGLAREDRCHRQRGPHFTFDTEPSTADSLCRSRLGKEGKARAVSERNSTQCLCRLQGRWRWESDSWVSYCSVYFSVKIVSLARTDEDFSLIWQASATDTVFFRAQLRSEEVWSA